MTLHPPASVRLAFFRSLLEGTGNLLVSNDDDRIRGPHFNSQLRRNFPSGVYYVLVRSYRDRDRGLYRYSESDTPALAGFHH